MYAIRILDWYVWSLACQFRNQDTEQETELSLYEYESMFHHNFDPKKRAEEKRKKDMTLYGILGAS